MRILLAVLVVLVLAMGYVTYLAWDTSVTLQAKDYRIDRLQKDNKRLVGDYQDLYKANTSLQANLKAAQEELQGMRSNYFEKPQYSEKIPGR